MSRDSDRRKELKLRQEKARRRLKVVDNREAVRPCNGCTACCSVFGVQEISKSPWITCEHQGERGCNIHQNHPKQCRGFYCLWQTGMGKEADRPDKLGAIFAPTNGPTEFTGTEEIQAYELKPLAFNNPAVVEIAQTFSAKGKLVIGHTYGGDAFRFVGPHDKIVKAMRWVELNQTKK